MDNDKKPAQYDTHYIANRMARTIGHVRLVRSMVECNADCTEVLIQLAAVQSALSGASRMILKDHISHCIVDAVEHHDEQSLEDLNHAIDHLLK